MKRSFSSLLVSSFVLFGTFVLNGCASINADLPVSRFESPESYGPKDRFHGQVSGTVVNRYTLTSDASARPVDLSHQSMYDDMSMGYAAGYQLLPSILDLSLRSTITQSPYIVTAKVQLLGPNREEAKAGDTSLAVTASIGFGGASKDGNQKGLFGPGGFPWKARVNNSMSDVALIAGHRMTDTTFIYGGGFYSNYSIKTTIDQSLSDDLSSPAASYSDESKGYQRGLNFGFGYSKAGGELMLELTYAEAFVGRLSNAVLRPGISLGIVL